MSIHVTVATVICKNDRFMVIRETSPNRPCAEIINQPAGHVEPGESLVAAAIRETLEETGWLCQIEHCVGIYHYLSPVSKTQYFRTCFSAKLIEQKFATSPDPAIVQTDWLSLKDIQSINQKDQALADEGKNISCLVSAVTPGKSVALRSPIVLDCFTDYLNGHRIPWQSLCETGLRQNHSIEESKALAMDQPAS